ncbi:MAG TPA: peptidylprolyl isomerase [Vicinamibacterales bacterium]|nr:peptidylprolyl isomerase [Vicinamibacterales bacterium]
MRVVVSVLAAALALSGASSGHLVAQDPQAVMVVLETEKGAIEIEVNIAKAPITAANFLKYVDGGFYDGGRFTRTVRPNTENRTDFPIQVIQAIVNPARAPERFPAITLERTNVTGILHKSGVVSMARGNAADTATNQFFICIGDQPELDFGGKRNADGQGFGAFGRVIIGMDVVETIQAAPVAKNPQDPKAFTQNLAPPIVITKARRK